MKKLERQFQFISSHIIIIKRFDDFLFEQLTALDFHTLPFTHHHDVEAGIVPSSDHNAVGPRPPSSHPTSSHIRFVCFTLPHIAPIRWVAIAPPSHALVRQSLSLGGHFGSDYWQP